MAARIRTLNLNVAGIGHDNRAKVARKCQVGEPISLVPEPTNPADKNAVKVCRANGQQVGYLFRDDAAEVAGKMRQGFAFEARVSELDLDEQPPRVKLQISQYSPEVAQQAKPPKAKGGCLRVVTIVFVVLLGLLAASCVLTAIFSSQ